MKFPSGLSTCPAAKLSTQTCHQNFPPLWASSNKQNIHKGIGFPRLICVSAGMVGIESRPSLISCIIATDSPAHGEHITCQGHQVCIFRYHNIAAPTHNVETQKAMPLWRNPRLKKAFCMSLCQIRSSSPSSTNVDNQAVIWGRCLVAP